MQEKTFAHRPKRACGQNFLTVPYYINRIAESVFAAASDAVLEIGPGKGALTEALLSRFLSLICVEFDRDLVPKLREKFAASPVTFHQADFLHFDLSQVPSPLHYAGNLPYNAGALILKKCLLDTKRTASVTFMLQREVVQRICSAPRSSDYGFLSVFCQYFGKPELLFVVPPGAFFPPPKIDSAVFRLIVDKTLSSRLPSDQLEPFFAFVSKGFSMRRKMLAKVLSFNGKPEDRLVIEDALDKSGIIKSARAEELSVEMWLLLYSNLKNSGAAVS